MFDIFSIINLFGKISNACCIVILVNDKFVEDKKDVNLLKLKILITSLNLYIPKTLIFQYNIITILNR